MGLADLTLTLTLTPTLTLTLTLNLPQTQTQTLTLTPTLTLTGVWIMHGTRVDESPAMYFKRLLAKTMPGFFARPRIAVIIRSRIELRIR